MKKRIHGFANREEGNIILLFAGVLVILIAFVGLALDMGMLLVRRNELQNLCDLVRESRFAHQDTIRFADDPGLTSYQVATQAIVNNGFGGELTFYYREDTPADNRRKYIVRTELTEEFEFSFLKVIGLDAMDIVVRADGGGDYGESTNDVVWRPAGNVANFNGTYRGTIAGLLSFDPGAFPADWP